MASVSMLKHWREAATLILVTPCAPQSRSNLSFVLTNTSDQPSPVAINKNKNEHLSSLYKNISQNFEVLMLKRSAKSKFMPNLYVYPGGVAVDNDFSSDWISQFRKVGLGFQQSLFSKLTRGSNVASPIFQRQRDSRFSQIPPELAFRISAIRETFEECGVLIARPVNQVNEIMQSLSKSWTFSPSSGFSDVKIMEEWRQTINKNPNEFLRMCQELNVVPAVWSLHEWSNWLTPVAATEQGRRFDTVFYICCLDHKPYALEDAAETVGTLWTQPSSSLASFHESKLFIAPPQAYELSRLLHFKTHVNLMDFVADREPQRVERFLPITVICDDYILSVLPGDDLYPDNPDDTPYIALNKTVKELNKTYVRHHRTVYSKNKSGRLSSSLMLQCNIKLKRGHIGPMILIKDMEEVKSNL